jgi:hypothetical protein
MSKVKDQHSEPQPRVTAHSIVAGALAVGPHATAINNQQGLNSAETVDAFLKLQRGIASLGLPEHERLVVDKDLQRLDRAVQATPPDVAAGGSHLKAVVDKLEMAGVVVSKIAALAEPARKIAEAVKLPLHMLGF